MYCIQCPEGRERMMVRRFTSGFLPQYMSANPREKKRKQLLLPGHVFSLSWAPGARKMEDDEARIVEILADPKETAIDKEGNIVSGPLKELADRITRVNAAHCAVEVSVHLLDEDRSFWISVARAGKDSAHPVRQEDPIPKAKEANPTIATETAPPAGMSPLDRIAAENARLKLEITRLQAEATRLKKMLLELVS